MPEIQERATKAEAASEQSHPFGDIQAAIYQSPFRSSDANKTQSKDSSTASEKPLPFAAPSEKGNRNNAGEQSLAIPPIFKDAQGEINAKPGDKVAALKAGPDGRIEITEKDFDKIGPKAKEVLEAAGVTKLTITPGKGFDTYEAELKKPLEVEQDPSIDGTRKLTMGTQFKADVTHKPDGSMSLDNIEGLTAESKILFKFREAQVEKISIKKTEDGQTDVTSTGSWNGHSGTKHRTQPGEIFDKAKILFDRMQELKGGKDFLDMPPIPGKK